MFWLKYMFFQLPSTIKVNLAAEIMQSAYLCVIFHFNLVSNSLVKFKMATFFGDVIGLQQRRHP